MGNIIVIAILILIIFLIIRSIINEHKRYGACAFCSYAHAGCDHVGHKELDEQKLPELNETQKAILAKHKRFAKKS